MDDTRSCCSGNSVIAICPKSDADEFATVLGRLEDLFEGSFEFRMGDVAPGRRLGAIARC